MEINKATFMHHAKMPAGHLVIYSSQLFWAPHAASSPTFFLRSREQSDGKTMQIRKVRSGFVARSIHCAVHNIGKEKTARSLIFFHPLVISLKKTRLIAGYMRMSCHAALHPSETKHHKSRTII